MTASAYWDHPEQGTDELIVAASTLVAGDIVEVLTPAGTRIIGPVTLDQIHPLRKWVWLVADDSRIDITDRYGSPQFQIAGLHVIAPAPAYRAGQVLRDAAQPPGTEPTKLFVADRLEWDDGEWRVEWTNVLDEETTGTSSASAFIPFTIGGERVFLSNLDPEGRP